jgi:ribosomal protein S6--L-glutamate ligase
MRIQFILNRRAVPEPSPVLEDAFNRLRTRGVEVDTIIPEECLAALGDLGPRHDLYVLKSHTELALSLAGTLVGLGAPLLNPLPSCLVTQDKITCTRLLSQAGVPVPPSWITGDFSSLTSLLVEGPLIAKPHRGHWGRGIHVLNAAHDIERLHPEAGPYLVQRYLSAGHDDLKAYVVGQEAFGVVKQFSETSFQHFGHPVDLDHLTREIVLACGAALGLHLYGVDLVQTDAGPYVVDVNYFPGYKGIPEAGELIADYIYQFAASNPEASP